MTVIKLTLKTLECVLKGFFSVKRKDTNWETSNGILSKILLQVGDHGKTIHFLYDYFDDFQKCSS